MIRERPTAPDVTAPDAGHLYPDTSFDPLRGPVLARLHRAALCLAPEGADPAALVIEAVRRTLATCRRGDIARNVESVLLGEFAAVALGVVPIGHACAQTGGVDEGRARRSSTSPGEPVSRRTSVADRRVEASRLDLEDIMAALRALPLGERVLVTLSTVAEVPARDLAVVVGWPPHMVRARLRLGRAALCAALERLAR